MNENSQEVADAKAMNVEEAEKVLTEIFDDSAETYDCCETQVFEPLAEELVRRAEIAEGSRVLDLGTGTGIAAFKALEKVGPDGYVLGIDVAAGLLAVAEEKVKRKDAENIEFKRMSMNSMDLSADSFDRVIGNFSLCCSFYYERALGEAHRVLKPGGRLAYSHDGPSQNPLDTVFDAVYSKHKVKEPSERLGQTREADSLQATHWSRFKDPFAALGALEAAGFREREASIFYPQWIFYEVEAYMDYRFTGGLSELELSEMGPRQRDKLRKGLIESLNPFSSKDGLVVRQEVLHLSGHK